jgi:hypothetical protein
MFPQVNSIMDDFRRKHVAELQALSAVSGAAMGYGLSSGGKQQQQQSPPGDQPMGMKGARSGQ